MTKVKYSFAQLCEDNHRQDLLDLWDYDLNDKNPNEISYGSSKKYWFKCPRGLHESTLCWLSSVRKKHIIDLCFKCNSLGQWLIDTYGVNGVNKYWSKMNTVDCFNISAHNADCKVFFKCDVNGHPDYLQTPRRFIVGHRCQVCSTNRLVKGYNDLATTYPHFVKYFLNKNEASEVTYGSSRIVDAICPDCGNICRVRVDTLISQGFSCKRCGDKRSYANKFMYELLMQLKEKNCIEFESEVVFEWSKNINKTLSKRTYDFYIYHHNIIIECHGIQHFCNAFSSINGARTLEEEKENDLFKYNLAIQNGFQNDRYIQLDCRKSTVSWIKNSIMNSNLPLLLNFTEDDINWNLCQENAIKNFVKVSADLWNSGLRSSMLIAKRIGVTNCTVVRYLKQATKLGWCDYTISDLQALSDMKPVYCTTSDMVFSSSKLCSEMSIDVFGINYKIRSIQKSATDNQTIKGLNFRYITKEEFLKIKSEHPERVFGNVYFYDAYNFVG